MKALVAQKEKSNPAAWLEFQTTVHDLKLKRNRLESEIQQLQDAIAVAEREYSKDVLRRSAEADAGPSTSGRPSGASDGVATVNIVLISGFESFNIGLYQQVASQLRQQMSNVRLQVFSDRDIASKRPAIEAALQSADVFFGSLLFDFDQVEWLKANIQRVPLRLVFESALELMSCTQIGTFQMDPSGKQKGPPPAVKKVRPLHSKLCLPCINIISCCPQRSAAAQLMRKLSV